MSKPKFAAVRSLFAGKGLPAAREDDETPTTAESTTPAAGAGPTEDEVNTLVAAESNKAGAAATEAANTRWNTVMTSDAGIANPKAAARLLNTTTMSADDVVATLGDLAPAAASTQLQQQREDRQQRNEQDRRELNDDANTRPDTGAAGGSRSQRRGEGDDRTASVREKREARAKKRNPANGKTANG